MVLTFGLFSCHKVRLKSSSAKRGLQLVPQSIIINLDFVVLFRRLLSSVPLHTGSYFPCAIGRRISRALTAVSQKSSYQKAVSVV